jgi:hypothetical protein
MGKKADMAAEDEDVYDGEHMSFHRSTQLCKVRSQQALRNMRFVHAYRVSTLAGHMRQEVSCGTKIQGVYNETP